MSRRSWKRIRPTGLRHALELCKDHAREVRSLSVERIADLMGVADHWSLYKWLQSGRIPAALIRPYEAACGIDYVTQWMAISTGKLLINIPTGRNASAADIQALQEVITHAVGQLLQFYAGKAEASDALAAIEQGMEGLAWHRANVQKHSQPELEFQGD